MALSSLLILGLVLIAFGASYYQFDPYYMACFTYVCFYREYSGLYTILILLVAPIPVVVAKLTGRNDFGSARKSSAQEAGLFATSAMATSALVFPIFLWHIGFVTSNVSLML
jgi:hypothetical protein